jgi:hypothetical protein
VLRYDLQVRTEATPNEVSVLEVEKDGKKKEGNEIQENQTTKGSLKEFPEMIVSRRLAEVGSRSNRLGGHAALYSGRPDQSGCPATRLDSSIASLAPIGSGNGMPEGQIRNQFNRWEFCQENGRARHMPGPSVLRPPAPGGGMERRGGVAGEPPRPGNKARLLQAFNEGLGKLHAAFPAMCYFSRLGGRTIGWTP